MPRIFLSRRHWIIVAVLLTLVAAGWQSAHHVHLPGELAHHSDELQHSALHAHPGDQHPDEDAEACDLCLQFSRLPAPAAPPIALVRVDRLQRVALAHTRLSPRIEPIPGAHRARGPPASHANVA